MSRMSDKEFMQLTVRKANEEKAPFAACIVKNNKVIVWDHSRVRQNNDPTSHGETETIRSACRKLRTPDLSGCILYTTCQPCPMCLAACYWARINRVVYGATLMDSKKEGWKEIDVSGKLAKKIVGNKVKLKGGIMRKECMMLLSKFH